MGYHSYMQPTQALKTAKLRNTKIRRHIYQALGEHHLLTADQITDAINAQGTTADRVTVYRNLDTFVHHQLACIHHFQDSVARYELRHTHHDHAFCTSCGKIQSIPCQSYTLQLKDFAIDHHHITIYGNCQKCQEEEL